MKYYDIENTEQRTILSELLCEYDPRYADEPIRNNLVIKLASKTVIDDLYELETFIIFHKSSISIMKHFANTETKNVVNLTTILKDFDTIETFMSDMTEESLLHRRNIARKPHEEGHQRKSGRCNDYAYDSF